MAIIIPGLILVFLLIVLAFIIVLNSESNEKKSVFGGLEMVLFLVMMPKNLSKKEGDEQKEEKITIAQMEQVFSNFLYLKKVGMFQDPPCCAFEIASQIGGSDISFYVAVPKYLESVFENMFRVFTLTRLLIRSHKITLFLNPKGQLPARI